jgi:hypothetical protein
LCIVECYAAHANKSAAISRPSTAIRIERNDDGSLAPAAFDLDTIRHEAREQTAAMAAQRFPFAYGRGSRFTLVRLIGHLRERLLSFLAHPE